MMFAHILWLCLAGLAPILSVLTPEVARSGTIFFLFIVERKIVNEHVWADFFNNNPLNEGRFRVIVHSAFPDDNNYKHFKVINIPVSKSNSCEDSVETMNKLLIHGLNATSHPSDYDTFIFLSEDAIPVKSFEFIYSHFVLTPSECDEAPNWCNPLKSSFCAAPIDEWEHNSISPSKRAVKHHQWIILNRADATTAVTKFLSIENSINHSTTDLFNQIASYPLLAAPNADVRRCLDEFWFFAAIYGDIDLTSRNPSNASGILLDIASDLEQGSCHTYVPGSYSSESIFSNGIFLAADTRIDRQIIRNPTMEFFSSLHKSLNFFFARRFIGHDPLTHVRGIHGEKLSLIEAIHHLKLYAPTKAESAAGATTGGVDASKLGGSGLLRQRRGGDKSGLKVLIVTADTRGLQDNIDANDYVSMTAVMLHEYAKAQGYDFIKITPNVSALNGQVFRAYCVNVTDSFCDMLGGGTGDKYGPSSFHPGLMQFRTSSWTKLPQLWFAVKEYGAHYDYVWFFDSDATINPLYFDISLSDKLNQWASDPKHIYWGPTNPRDAIFLFFSNFPWRADMPCAGVMIFKPREAEPLLRDWWDYNLPGKNFYDFMEQDAMWHMLESADQYGFLLNKTVTTLLKEPQFPSIYYGVNSLWLVHVPNYVAFRMQYMRYLLQNGGLKNKQVYEAIVQSVRKYHFLELDIFTTAVAMDICSAVAAKGDQSFIGVGMGKGIFDCAQSKVFDPTALASINKPTVRRPAFPPDPTGRADDAWHLPQGNENQWDKFPGAAPTGELYNRMVLMVKPQREIWVVMNGTRHGFPDMDTFLAWGFDVEDILIFTTRNSENGIPVGDPIPAGSPPWHFANTGKRDRDRDRRSRRAMRGNERGDAAPVGMRSEPLLLMLPVNVQGESKTSPSAVLNVIQYSFAICSAKVRALFVQVWTSVFLVD